jgi:hypothetical protein
MDAATGLLYVGDGQYYDPSTGRFLTRNAKPNQTNPYLPFDPAGAMLGPLGVLALVLGSKKKKSKYDVLLFILVFAVASGMTLSACTFTAEITPTEIPMPGYNVTVTTEDGTTEYFIPTLSTTPSAPPAYPCPTPETPIPPTPTPAPERFEKIIFICGVGDRTPCANGGAPLNPFRRWAEKHGYSASDFSIHDVDVCGEVNKRKKLECANRAISNIESNSSRFLLIGHSAGADAVIVAVDRVSDKSKIAGIVLLDPTLGAALENDDPDIGEYTDLQTMADNLPSPKFLGDSPEDGYKEIRGVHRVPYDNYNHKQLALEDAVVNDMVDRFGWSELK